jgi:hypothetical protein
MPSIQKAEICYILAFPDRAISTAKSREQIRGLKDAPYFSGEFALSFEVLMDRLQLIGWISFP